MTIIVYKKKSKTKQAFENKVWELEYLKIKVTPEFKFAPDRRFKADFMLEYNGKQILVEYEGIYGCQKSRHSTVRGYSIDTEKYNLASQLGFQVLRYTASTYKKVTDNITKIFGL